MVAVTAFALTVIMGAVAFIFWGPRTVAPELRPPPVSVTRTKTVPGWTDLLHAGSCPPPCSGGAACAVTTENSAKAWCREDAGRCDACLSGVTCITGDTTALFTGAESWRFYLSAIAERGLGRSVLDPCETQRNIWLCIRSRSRPEPSCVSQVEACRNGARGTTAVPITSDDLISSGLDLEIREGGPGGVVLAVKTGAKYTEGVRRTSLCGGLKATFPHTTPVAYVTYFLDASSDTTAAVPVRASKAPCRAEDWISRVPSTEQARRNRTATGDDAMKEGKVRDLGDLNGDGLPEYEIAYAWGATGWGMTLLSSTGDADCFKTIYEGAGSVASYSEARTKGWRDITVAYSELIGDRGRGVVTTVAHHGVAGYVLGEVVACMTLGGDIVGVDDCRKVLARD